MSSTVQRLRAQYEAERGKSRRQAALNLQTPSSVEFYIAGWSRKTESALADQWKGEHVSEWDWPEIFRRHNDPDRLDMAIWSLGDRLGGLGLGLVKGEYLELRFVEGDPRPDCPLKGRRALIMLECSALYAQARGRSELRIEPINERIATLYQQIYGFTVATDRTGRAYYVKRV